MAIMALNKPVIGRQTILNPTLITLLSDIVSKGNYAITAIKAAGISEKVYYKWQKRGGEDEEKGKDTIYVQFLQSIKRAEATAEQIMVERLREAASPGLRKTVTRTDADGGISVEQIETGGDWLPAATFLERRHPERWGRKDRIQAATVTEDNRVINILVVDKETKGLIAQVKGRTGKLIEELPEGENDTHRVNNAQEDINGQDG